jgi:hypothetical protein
MESGAGEQLIDVIATYGLRVIGGIVLLILGWMLANWIAKVTKRQLHKSGKVDATLRPSP